MEKQLEKHGINSYNKFVDWCFYQESVASKISFFFFWDNVIILRKIRVNLLWYVFCFQRNKVKNSIIFRNQWKHFYWETDYMILLPLNYQIQLIHLSTEMYSFRNMFILILFWMFVYLQNRNMLAVFFFLVPFYWNWTFEQTLKAIPSGDLFSCLRHWFKICLMTHVATIVWNSAVSIFIIQKWFNESNIILCCLIKIWYYCFFSIFLR